MTVRKKATPSATSPIFLRFDPDQRKRLKHMCIDDGMTYAEFVLDAMDRRDRRKSKAGAVARSPLHDLEDFDA